MGKNTNLNNPFFSVIIPTFNRACELKRCLNSLDRQTFKNFEVLICDDGSTDNTQEVVRLFSEKLQLTYLFQENWGGPAKPRNNGIINAKGEWICFLDSDDWWFPNKLTECFKHVQQFDFIFHNSRNYLGDTLINKKLINRISLQTFYSPKNIHLHGNYISCSSVCIKKKFTHSNFFSEDKNIIALEDYFAWIKLFQRNNIRIKYIRKALSAYSMGTDNISSYNRSYLDKLFSFKRKIKCELGINVSETCINYLIGINLIYLNNKKANNAFKYSFVKSNSVLIKIKSLIHIFK